MNYLDAVKTLEGIEEKYDVMSIKSHNVSVWPYLRIYIFNKLYVDKNPQTVSSNYKLILKTLFKYNPLRLFKHYSIWTICSTLTRKKIGETYYQQICGGLSELGVNMLLIEKADKVVGHYDKKHIPEKDVFSMSWLYLSSFALERILRIRKLHIKNESIIKQILNDYKIEFDYKFYIRLLIAQEKSTSFLLMITHKPKLLFVQAAYVFMGVIWAFHKRGIPVVELQHGVLNKHHYGYNSPYRYDLLMPDQICVFGEQEYDYFMSDESQFCKKVIMTGLYILEKADDLFKEDIFDKYRHKYSKIIVVSGQYEVEQDLLNFEEELALTHKELLFVHIPRHKNTQLIKQSENIIIIKGVNIYEYLKWCDIHMTVSSTTCIEAHYFRKPNIIYDLGKEGSTYYQSVIDERNGAFYVNNKNEFDYALKRIEKNNFVFKELYAHNSKSNLKSVIGNFI